MKRLSLILIIALLFSLTGCSTQMPEGFENEQVYKDLVDMLEVAREDYESYTSSYMGDYITDENYNGEHKELFDRFVGYLVSVNDKNNSFTQKETIAINSVMDIVAHIDVLNSYDNNSSRKRHYEESIKPILKELIDILELNTDIQDW